MLAESMTCIKCQGLRAVREAGLDGRTCTGLKRWRRVSESHQKIQQKINICWGGEEWCTEQPRRRRLRIEKVIFIRGTPYCIRAKTSQRFRQVFSRDQSRKLGPKQRDGHTIIPRQWNACWDFSRDDGMMSGWLITSRFTKTSSIIRL